MGRWFRPGLGQAQVHESAVEQADCRDGAGAPAEGEFGADLDGVSPDGRYVVTVNAGYGTYESRYEQSLAVLDTRTGKVADFPDDRTGLSSEQTLYSGLAFSADGRHIYASVASLTDADWRRARILPGTAWRCMSLRRERLRRNG